jgi:hypothetical protein
MKPHELAMALVADHDITQMVGSKHHNPGSAVVLLTRTINQAILAERERCARIVEEFKCSDGMCFFEAEPFLTELIREAP